MIAMLDGKGEPGDGGYYVDMSHDIWLFIVYSREKFLLGVRSLVWPKLNYLQEVFMRPAAWVEIHS